MIKDMHYKSSCAVKISNKRIKLHCFLDHVEKEFTKDVL